MSKSEPRRRLVLRGYGQIRRFWQEMGINPPPHVTSLRSWRENRGCPIRHALGGHRVVADAQELARWIRDVWMDGKPPADPKTTAGD